MLDSPAYRAALANQTDWSKANIGAFQEHDPRVARITISRGQGRGAALGIIRLRPVAGSEENLRAALREQLDPAKLDGIISMHLIESDPALSKPLTDDASRPNPGAGRLVRPDRCDRCERGSGGRRARFADNAAFKSARDFERRLQADVGPGEKRDSGGLITACTLVSCCTAAKQRDNIND